MKWMRMGLLLAGVAFGMVVLMDARAQEEKKRGKGPGGFGGFAQGPLVSKDLADKLNLSTEQKTKVDKLNTEFTEKTKDTFAKLKELREKGKDGGKEVFKEIREQTDVVRKARTDLEGKVKDLLKDDQKKTFEDAIAQRRQGGFGGFPGGGRGGQGTLLSRDVQEKLGLSAEQKEKLDKLKKDFDTKTEDVLTAEQKKKFEELKKEAPRPGGRRGGNRQDL